MALRSLPLVLLLSAPLWITAVAGAEEDEGLGWLSGTSRLPASLESRAKRVRALGSRAARREFVRAVRSDRHAFEGRAGRAVALALGACAKDDEDGELAILALQDAVTSRPARQPEPPIGSRNRGTIALVLARTHHPLAEATLLAWTEGSDEELRSLARGALLAHPPLLGPFSDRGRTATSSRRFSEEFARYLTARPSEKLDALRRFAGTLEVPAREDFASLLAADPVWGARLLAAFAWRTPSLRSLSREVARQLASQGPVERSAAQLLEEAAEPRPAPPHGSGSLSRVALRATRLANVRDFLVFGAPHIEAELRKLEGNAKRAFLFGLGESRRKELVPLLLDDFESEEAGDVRAAVVAALRRILGPEDARLDDVRDFDPEPACRFLASHAETERGAEAILEGALFAFADPKQPYELVTSEGRPFAVSVAPDGFVSSIGVPLRPRSLP